MKNMRPAPAVLAGWGCMRCTSKLKACTVTSRDFTDRKDIFITNGVRGWYKRTSSLGKGFLTQALE